jgi:hypothetical protein
MPAKKTTEEFVRDAILVHGDKYDYSKVDYKNPNEKVIIICKTHGDILQRPNDHLNTLGCSKCSGRYQYSTKEWVMEAKKNHGDKYNYEKVEYKTNKSKVIIICKTHGEFLQQPSSHLSGKGCKKCSYITNGLNLRKLPKEFIKQAKEIHGDTYYYSKVDYTKSNEKVIIICKEHGEFLQSPDGHLTGSGCSKCAGCYNYTTEEWVTKAKEIHGDIYNYEKVDYKTNKSKVIIICKIHGEFLQNAKNHIIQLHKCPKCVGGILYTHNEWILKAIEIYGDRYDYSKVDYKNSSSKVIIICKIHGEFLQIPSSHLQGHDCQKCAYIVNGLNLRKSQDEFIKQSIKLHDNKFGYDKVIYKTTDTNVIIICKIHGEFTQTPHSHLNGAGCSKCAGTYSYTTEEWVEIANKKHNSVYDYSKVKYIGNKTNVIIICKTHEEFLQTPNNHLRGAGCSKCQLCPSCQLWRTNGKLCGYCLPKNKNKLYQKTKEYVVVKYLKEHLPDYDFIHNQSVGSECTKGEKEKSNGHLYPDIRYDCGHYHLIVEVDEHRHRGADYKCDEQRMYDIIGKLGLPCIFIRYNPDSKESNKDILLQKIKDYLELDVESDNIWDDYGFKVKHLFY